MRTKGAGLCFTGLQSAAALAVNSFVHIMSFFALSVFMIVSGALFMFGLPWYKALTYPIIMPVLIVARAAQWVLNTIFGDYRR
jgi:hypothetical protein